MTNPMYEPVILRACKRVTLIQKINPAKDTAAATEHAMTNPTSVGELLLIPLNRNVATTATAKIFHRACDSTPSENMETKM